MRRLLAVSLLLTSLLAIALLHGTVLVEGQSVERRDVKGIVTGVKGMAFHLYLPEQRCFVIVVPSEEVKYSVSPGDYVRVVGYTPYVYLVKIDPITGLVFTVDWFIWAEKVTVLGKAADLWIDKGCGAVYSVGERIQVFFKLSFVEARVRLIVDKPNGRALILDRVLGPGTYRLEGIVGEPPGRRLLTLEVRLPLSRECMPPEYYEYELLVCTCAFEAVWGADLTVKSVDVASELEECSEALLYVTVVNEGKGPAPASTLAVLLGDTVLREVEVPPMEPGESEVLELGFTIPCCAPSKDLRIVTDYCNVVREQDEGNNEYVLRGAIRARSPELSLSISQAVVTAGVRTKLRLTVANVGRGRAVNARLEIDPPPGLKVSQTSWNLGELPPGASKAVEVEVLAERAGEYELPAQVRCTDECGRAGVYPQAFKLVAEKRPLKLRVEVSPPITTVLKPVKVNGSAPPEAADLRLEIMIRRPGGEWTKVGEVEVGKDGSFSFTYTPKKAGRYEVGVHYPGDEVWAEASAYASLEVRRINVTVILRAPSRIPLREEARIKILIRPARTARGLLKLIAPNGSSIGIAVELEGGEAEVSLKPDRVGSWTIEFLVPGDDVYEDGRASLVLTVVAVRLAASPPAVAAAIATGAAVSVATMISSVRKAISSTAERVRRALEGLGIRPPEWLEALCNIYLEEVFKSVTEKEVPPPSAWRLITPPEFRALLFSIAIMSIVFSYVESGGAVLKPEVAVQVLLPATLASTAVTLTDELSEAVASKLRGFWAEYNIWPHGAISMILTGFLLNSPFASPARTLFAKGYPEEEKARLVLYKFLSLTALSGLFAALMNVGLDALGDAGLVAALATLFYSLFPVPPLPGYELVAVSKIWWLVTFIASGALYAAVLLRALQLYVIEALGLIALTLLLLEAVWRKLRGGGVLPKLIGG